MLHSVWPVSYLRESVIFSQTLLLQVLILYHIVHQDAHSYSVPPRSQPSILWSHILGPVSPCRLSDIAGDLGETEVLYNVLPCTAKGNVPETHFFTLEGGHKQVQVCFYLQFHPNWQSTGRGHSNKNFRLTNAPFRVSAGTNNRKYKTEANRMAHGKFAAGPDA